MSLRIAVCVAAVPNPEKVKWDRFRQLLDVQDAEPVLNPADRIALEVAAQFAKVTDSTFDAYCAGAGASAALREAAAFGVNRLVAISDSALDGADEAGIAAALVAAITKNGGADVVVCGTATSSFSSGAVPGYLSEGLGAQLRTGAVAVEPQAGSSNAPSAINVTLINGNILQRVPVALPVVIGASPYGVSLRAISPLLLMRAAKKTLDELSLADTGAPTPLPSTGATDGPLQSNRKKRGGEIVEGPDAASRAITLVAALRERQLV